jgi:SAM-dependent methyltransferase
VYDEDYYAGRGVDPLVQYAEEYENWRRTIRVSEFEDLLAIVRRHFDNEATLATGRFNGRPVKWLDYGCGAGALLRFLRQGPLRLRGVDVSIEAYGSDLGAWAERLARDGERILDEAELARLPEGTFDVVSCIEVLEHTVDPAAVVLRLARCLAPGGILLLTTGNLASPLAKLMGFRFPYCVPEMHISLFEPALLARLYAAAGLVPTRAEMRGILEFKVLKNLGRLRQWTVARWVATRRPTLFVFDLVFGVSRMPFAVKPLFVEAAAAERPGGVSGPRLSPTVGA